MPAASSLPAPAAAERHETWDHSTLRLNRAEVSLFAALGDAAQRRHSLVHVNGEHAGQRHAMVGDKLVIGRAPNCELCLDSAGISRLHAELRERDGQIWLHDLGSSNGTWLNDRRVDMPLVVKDGDVLRLGNVLFKFYERHSLDALLHDRLYRLATVDAGTDCYSKKYLLETLEREVQLARRGSRPLTVVALDLDQFKAVNDRFGHNAGDEVLRGVAAAVQAAVRPTDVLGRMGGEELTAVLPDTDIATAVELAERMRRAVASRLFELRDAASGGLVMHRQTASLGVAALGPAMKTARDLLGAADEQLYAAKRGGRNRVIA